MIERCHWAKRPLEIEYHDHEWCVPSYDDRYLFEMLVLESAQAGLSWHTILQKREAYRICFHNFEVEKVSKMTLEEALEHQGIVQNN